MATRKRNSGQEGSYRRPAGMRHPNLVAWIFCEGEQTERLYFESFRVAHRIIGVKIKPVGGDSLRVVETAIGFYQRNRPQSEEWDEIWCVFDRDNISSERFRQAFEMKEQFNKEGLRARSGKTKDPQQRPQMHIAYSNPCFELWYLLHFQYCDTPMPCSDYCTKLSERLGIEYQKNLADMYGKLVSRQDGAISNAKRRLADCDAAFPADGDPSSTVHLLVETLNSYRQG